MEKKIDLVLQMILGAIPFLLPQLYAFGKIKRGKKGAILLGLIYGVPPVISIIISVINWFNMNLVGAHFSADFMGIFNSIMGFFITMTYPPLSFVALIFYVLIPVYFVRKWTIEYNSKISTTSAE